MIQFEKFTLENGLTVIIHEDHSTPMVAVNITYKVGSKDEDPDKTGFAHLFEHLMFGGSIHIRDFDKVMQDAGGENNAFTNADLTSFYDIVPAENLETVLWLESDRMMQLNFSDKVLKTQKKVVIEEFKETCLNEPYGDMWHHLSEIAYKDHPYQWPTIGKDIQHIADASLDQVELFFNNFYKPGNAILALAGHITTDQAKALVLEWFGDIPKGETIKKPLPCEPKHTAHTKKEVKSQVPHEAIFLAYNMGDRLSKEYYICDLISDLLANGRSSRFYKRLYKEKQYFSTIDAFISGSIDPGLFIIEGKLMPGVSIDQARESILEELELLKTEPIPASELQKLKNSVESSLTFSEISVLNKAISLAYFEALGDANLINEEANRYQEITASDIMQTAQSIFSLENCNELIYYKADEANNISK
ncbi:MAG: insulinase family protein [Chitinophagales bacterium]|nr:insulinase family protein [Chitinophagales bacterium]